MLVESALARARILLHSSEIFKVPNSLDSGAMQPGSKMWGPGGLSDRDPESKFWTGLSLM